MEDGYEGILWAYSLLLIVPVCLQYAFGQLATKLTDSPFRFDMDRMSSMFTNTIVLLVGFALLVFFSIRSDNAHGRELWQLSEPLDRMSSTSDRPKCRALNLEVVVTFSILAYCAKGLKIDRGELECAVCLTKFEDHELECAVWARSDLLEGSHPRAPQWPRESNRALV